MSASAAFVRTFRIAGFEAEVTIPRIVTGAVSNVCVEWSPRVPRMDVEFSPAERAKYQRLLSDAITSAL